MIHSLSGGIITEYDTLIYVFVQIDDGIEQGAKRWYISPFPSVRAGDRVEVPCGRAAKTCATVTRVERVTAQTAPFPVNRTAEIERILP